VRSASKQLSSALTDREEAAIGEERLDWLTEIRQIESFCRGLQSAKRGLVAHHPTVSRLVDRILSAVAPARLEAQVSCFIPPRDLMAMRRDMVQVTCQLDHERVIRQTAQAALARAQRAAGGKDRWFDANPQDVARRVEKLIETQGWSKTRACNHLAPDYRVTGHHLARLLRQWRSKSSSPRS
jgi:hypothetical protein